ncbi:MAG TPA: LuxR C-terminal-related transcriptional regulator [Actinospica sp.]|nr:LuxR C-terminal-related transcriptional regulator [Actinospica sp.]
MDIHHRSLTARETTLLELVAGGLTNRQIARRLQISEKTVKNHLSAIFPKIGATARTQAAVYAIGQTTAVAEAPERPSRPATEENLTPREWSVLDLVAHGLTNRQIARRLEISEKTVKNHLSAIFPKIGATHRTQAAVYAVGRARGRGAALGGSPVPSMGQ